MSIMLQAHREYRRRNPKSRAPGPIIYHLNGANGPRQKRCVLCGELGPSWCGKYRMTKRAERWEREHDCSTYLLCERYDPVRAFSHFVPA
jgi:hypothetical protein